MHATEVRAVVLDVLGEVAPEARAVEIRPEVNFREQFDFDSLDFLNFAIGLHQRLGVEIPEVDYPKLSCLDGCVAYLAPRLAADAEA
jgi:acyl carrier protein